MSVKETVKGYMFAEDIGLLATGTVYNQGKAKIFNILESQMEPSERLFAVKRLAEDAIGNISRDVKRLIVDVLGSDFSMEVETDRDAVMEPSEEASREYEELKKVVR